MDEYKIKQGVRMILEGIGEDPERPGLLETPDRVARMYEEIYAGMHEDAMVHLEKVFPVEEKGMIIEQDIAFHSVCEHHLLPFFGKVHIGYLPNGNVVGLSKLARTVEVFARRLQIQEHLAGQIADALMEHLQTNGVIVMIEAEHMCITMRGVKKAGSQTVTLVKRGRFTEEQSLVEEFFRMIGR